MKKLVGVIIIGIMFLSSLAFAGIQAVNFGQPSSQENNVQGNVELPSQVIIDYRLSPAQFNQVLARGFTVATYSYDKSCFECADERGFIERLVLSQEFQGQIILEEIERSGQSGLEVASVFGRKKLDAIEPNSTVEAFCELVVSPPVGCAVR